MCDLHHVRGAKRAYPSRPIDFSMFDYFIRSVPGIEVEAVADEFDGDRTLALLDDETGHIELIAVPLDSGTVGFQVRSSPSRRIQRLICDRFGVDFVYEDNPHHVDFVAAETTNWMPHSAAG